MSTGVRRAEAKDCRDVAELHRNFLPESFLGTLPLPFLRLLYSALCDWEKGILLVVEENGKIKGFLSGTVNTRKFFAYFKKTRFFRGAVSLLPVLIRKGAFIRIRETVLYGSRNENNASFPEAELLSIVVAGSAQGQGLGNRLFDAFAEWCAAQGVKKFKIAAGEQLEKANSFYRSRGCEIIGECRVHKQERSIVYSYNTEREK